MKQNNLSSTGLSMSQAQSISNLCHQRAAEIGKVLSSFNNASKSVHVGDKDYVTITGNPITANVADLISEMSKLHACQAFLRENMVVKDTMLANIKKSSAGILSIPKPKSPTYTVPTLLSSVTEDFGWEQLTSAEINTYLEAEAFASHVGKFIHAGGTLAKLRDELPSIPAIDWMIIEDGKKSPVTIEVHHKSEDLLALHEKLAELHRGYEQKVNYFKAKVKNLTTLENARIAKLNADAQIAAAKVNNDLSSEFEKADKLYWEQVRTVQAEFEKERQANISVVAATKIEVDPRFQATVDLFLAKLPYSK